MIDRASAIRLLPKDVPDWDTWIDQAIAFAESWGWGDKLHDPYWLALEAGVKYHEFMYQANPAEYPYETPKWWFDLKRKYDFLVDQAERDQTKMPTRQALGKTIWRAGNDESMAEVLEAHRRITERTGDGRSAAALTLAWAMLEASHRRGG